MRLSQSAEEAELLAGFELGFYPQPADAAARDGVTVTTSMSWWNDRRRCDACRQTFRRGDRVLVDHEAGTVRHLVPGLRCEAPVDAGAGDRAAGGDAVAAGGAAGGDAVAAAGGAAAGTEADLDDGSADVVEFTEGLLTSWPPQHGLRVTVLRRGDWRIAGPRSGPLAPTCPFCGHTFRIGDQVVICPCNPARPNCGIAVHRDPVAGLTCWESWQPDGVLRKCPIVHGDARGRTPY